MDHTLLKINNIKSKLITYDRDVIGFLANCLRRRPKNFWHSTAYKKKKWDGWNYFFNKKTGEFQTGLLPEVRAALKHLKVNYNISDQRKFVNWKYDNIGQNFLDPWLPPSYDPIELHDYQPDFVNQAIKYNRGIIQAPTGAGKTFIMISLLKCLPPKTPVLFMTKNAGLTHQNWEDMKLWGVPDLGRWYGTYKEPNYVMCCTVHSKTLESISKLIPKFKVLVVDEVHECISKVPIAAYNKMKNASVRLGFSATPFKPNKKKVDEVHKWNTKGFFGPIFKTKTTSDGRLKTKDLQDRGILSKSKGTFYIIKEPNLSHEPYQDAIKLGIEENFYFHEVVQRLERKLKGRTLIVVERRNQGEYLKQLIPHAHWVHGDIALKKRKPVLEDLKNKPESTAIFMRHIITAGINVKVHNLVNASCGEGSDRTIQFMGRGLRLAEDKDILEYYDFYFKNNPYLMDHSEWRMEVLEKEGHEVKVKEIDF